MKIFQFVYRPRYYLTHPWEAWDDICRSLKFAWQRVTRGWDDSAIWSIDMYICGQMVEMLKRLRETQNGCPPAERLGCEPGQQLVMWDSVLVEIEEGFAAGLSIIEDDFTLWDEIQEEWDKRYPGRDKSFFLDSGQHGYRLEYRKEYDELFVEYDYWNKRKEYYQGKMKIFHRGMILFHKHFFELWD